MTSLIETRRAETERKLEQFKTHLEAADKRVSGKACVYLTGSFARGEASQYSDLDLFIVGRSQEVDGKQKRALSRLDEICVKADLITMTRTVDVREFSGDGEYLVHYSIDELVRTLGRPEDDANNTFTARMLLLLESRPLLGADVHDDAIDQVLARYWRDYEDHQADFMPAFLANDILRMWRTFCVNYEARTESDPVEKKAKRKLKNYKLKHSRLLTCYSALAHLSALYTSHGTVTPDEANEMAKLSPTARLEQIRAQGKAGAAGTVTQILECYAQFLESTDHSEDELVDIFMDAAKRRALTDANRLGELMAQLLNELGDGSRFHRLLLV